MTNVLVIAPTPFFSDRGCHVRIYEVTRSLQRIGQNPLVLTYPRGDDPPGLRVIRSRTLKGYSKLEAGPAWPRLFIDLSLYKQASGIVRKENPDLVYAFLHEGTAIARLLRARHGVPFIFDYQGSLTLESLQHGFITRGWMEKAFLAVERSLDSSADEVVTSADHLGGVLRDRGITAHTVPDGVDAARFSPGSPDRKLCAGLGLPADKPVLVYLGVMSDYQGVDILLESALLLKREGVPAHFLLMGYPEDFYKHKAEEMDLCDMVTFTGRVDYGKAPEYLRLGTLALAPKLADTESNGKVLNYLASGLPVVAFDTDINRELLADCAAWAKLEVDRRKCAQSFAGAMAALLSNPAKARSLSEAGRKRAAELYSLERQAEKLRDVCARALAKPHEPAARFGKMMRVFLHQFERAGSWMDLRWRRLTKRRISTLGTEALHWSAKKEAKIIGWQDHPLVRRHINTRVTGGPDANWLDDFFARWCPGGVDHAANLGFGFGDLEAHALSTGMVQRFFSVDISEPAAEYCRRHFKGFAASFQVSDLNRVELGTERFDAVFAASVLHHVLDLEHLLDEVGRCLRPGGWFVFDEYTGPSRFQWRAKQLEIVNELLAALPGKYKHDLRRRFFKKRRVYPNPLDDTSRDSPFEAVRSEEILPLVSERFEIVRRAEYGGALLHPLLDGIAGNFRQDRGEDMLLLFRLMLLERELESGGAVSSDFTSVVARRT